MKIYTKKGDAGQTSLFGGGPYPKDDARIEAYGEVDELNSVLGCAGAECQSIEFVQPIVEVQKQLFMVGAELATVDPSPALAKGFISSVHIRGLEAQIDAWEKDLPPLKKFILPGGSRASAFLHLARTVGRRAERRVVHLSHEQKIRPEVLEYMNRLSDWIFVLARRVNRKAGVEDLLWEGILKS
jgi:ATP:cob(I)alamin adenosyltransferase